MRNGRETTPHDGRSRVNVSYDGVLIASDGHKSVVVVKDVSANGCRVEIKDDLVVGEEVSLKVGKGGPFRCEVRWARGSEVGLLFLHAPQIR